MNRRRFIGTLGVGISAAGALPLLAASGGKLSWQRDKKTRLFTGVSADGVPLVAQSTPGPRPVSSSSPRQG